MEYKRPAGTYLLRNFHKICRVCTPFQDALAIQISLDLLKGLWSYGGFKLRGSGFPQIFSAPYASDPQKFWMCKNVLEVLYHRAKFGGARISSAAGVAKNVDFLFVCLSVGLFVSHAFERQRSCARFRHEGVGVQKRF